MLHKGKLQAALNAKRGQFSLFDDSFSEQLQMYQHALETLYVHFPSSSQLEHALPPNESGMPSAGARPATSLIAGWYMRLITSITARSSPSDVNLPAMSMPGNGRSV